MTRNSGKDSNASIQSKSMAPVPPSGDMIIQNFARNPVLVNSLLSALCIGLGRGPQTWRRAYNDRAEHPAPSSHGTRTAASEGWYGLGAVLEAALGRPRSDGLLHGGGRDVARACDVLCPGGDGAGHPARPARRHHAASHSGLHAAMRAT